MSWDNDCFLGGEFFVRGSCLSDLMICLSDLMSLKLWDFPSVSLSAAATVAMKKTQAVTQQHDLKSPECSSISDELLTWIGGYSVHVAHLFATWWTWVWDSAAPYKPPRASWNRTQLGLFVRFPHSGSSRPSALLVQSNGDGKLRNGKDSFQFSPQRRWGQNISFLCLTLWERLVIFICIN